jgi:hypothetical protein
MRGLGAGLKRVDRPRRRLMTGSKVKPAPRLLQFCCSINAITRCPFRLPIAAGARNPDQRRREDGGLPSCSKYITGALPPFALLVGLGAADLSRSPSGATVTSATAIGRTGPHAPPGRGNRRPGLKGPRGFPGVSVLCNNGSSPSRPGLPRLGRRRRVGQGLGLLHQCVHGAGRPGRRTGEMS